MASLLTRITSGKIERPLRVGITGPPGIGKSTFAAGAPKPLFLDADRRTNHLDLEGRVQPDTASGSTPWTDILDTMRELSIQKPGDQYETLVVDTLDAVEQLLHRELCERYKVPAIGDIPGSYGTGYRMAQTEWQRFYAGVDILATKGFNVILIVHCELRRFGNPAGDDYDYWAVKLDKKANALFFQQVDCLGFATWDDTAIKVKGDSKPKARTSGDRVLRFAHDPAYQTKRGVDGIPDECELSWEAFCASREE